MGEPLANTSPGQEIGALVVDRELPPGRSLLAVAPGGRRVVVKPLEEDCLLGNQIHPMIRDRLGRVRELAHLGVANLLGAERQGGQLFLVWEYVEGQPLEDYLAGNPGPGPRLTALARELVLSVESLHALGIVHGQLHERNVIVMPDGRLRLTHISPLLYSDPQADVDALLPILERMGCSPVLSADEENAIPLHELAARLVNVIPVSLADRAVGAGAPAAEGASLDRGAARRIALAGALTAAVAGTALAWGLIRYARSRPAPPPPPEVSLPRGFEAMARRGEP